MIVKDLQPISMVEDQSFRHFMKVSDPQYQIPSRKSMITGEIPKLYEEALKTVKNSILHILLTRTGRCSLAILQQSM